MQQFYPLVESDITPLTPKDEDISFEIHEYLKEVYALESFQNNTDKHNNKNAEIIKTKSMSSKPKLKIINIIKKKNN